MSKVFVGGITPEGEAVLNKYLDKYAPDASIEPLKPIGIRGKIKNHAKRANVILVILDESLYETCEDACGDVLKMPKVHKYVSDAGLEEFLRNRFGVLDDSPSSPSIPEGSGNDIEIQKPIVIEEEPEPLIPLPDANSEYYGGNFSSPTEEVYVEPEVITESKAEPIVIPEVVEQVEPEVITESKAEPVVVPEVVEQVEPITTKIEPTSKEITVEKVDSIITPEPIVIPKTYVEPERASEPKVEPTPVVSEPVYMSHDSMDIDFGSSIVQQEEPSGSTEAAQEIAKLKSELSQNQVLIRSLTAQLEGNSSDDDISLLTTKIRELKSELEDKDIKIRELENEQYTNMGKALKAEQTLSQVKTMEYEIKGYKEQISQLEAEKSSLSIKVEDLNSQVEELDSIKAQLGVVTSSLSQEKHNHAVTDANYQSKCDEYDSLVSRYNNLESKSKADTLELETTKESLQNIRSEKETLEANLGVLQSSLDQANLKVTNLEGQLSDKVSEYDALVVSDTACKEKITTLEKSIITMQTESENTITTLNAKVSSSESELMKATSTNNKLIDENASLQSQVSNLQKTNASLSNSCEELKANITVLQSTIEGYKNNESALYSQIDAIRSDNTSVTDELTKKNNEISELKKEIATFESRELDFSTQQTTSKEQINEYESKISSLNDELASTKLELTNTKLQLNNMESDAIDKLQEKNAELVAKNIELKTTIETLSKKAEEESKTAGLRLEIIDLKEQIQVLEAERSNTDDIDRANKEISSLRERNAELELSLASKSEALEEHTEGVYSQLQENAMPKVKIGAMLKVDNIVSKFCVVASSSTASNLTAYQLMRETCERYANKRILLVDLSSDSYVDAEFKPKSVLQPTDWLTGKIPFSKCVTATSLKNVKLISVGLSYLNSLYLLNVDWSEKMKDLRKCGDIVMFYVGCLNDTVSKVLYQSFAQEMSGYIVVNSSPINLRTTFLALSGMEVNSNTLVCCTNYTNASGQMYKHLASKFDSTIIQEGGVIELKGGTK